MTSLLFFFSRLFCEPFVFTGICPGWRNCLAAIFLVYTKWIDMRHCKTQDKWCMRISDLRFYRVYCVYWCWYSNVMRKIRGPFFLARLFPLCLRPARFYEAHVEEIGAWHKKVNCRVSVSADKVSFLHLVPNGREEPVPTPLKMH